MLFDPRQARDALVALLDVPVDARLLPPGLPAHECTRSPAARRVSELGAESGLFLFHYEHRAHLPLPTDWVPAESPELAESPEWTAGVLPESKYQSFRHDQAIGGFHPGHRGKWTTHELCHGLVGFAWSADASPLFHATAGRLAELLPVVLYYFLDEVFLDRCPVHRGGGPLYRSFCADCDAIRTGPIRDDPDALSKLTQAATWLDKELAAVQRTRNQGIPISHRYGSLDLTTDGMAYARAHGPRLRSPQMLRYADACLVPDGFGVESLDALIARVEAVVAAITSDTPLAPWAPTPGVGRTRWALQDVAWRMLQASDVVGFDAVATAIQSNATDVSVLQDIEVDPLVLTVGYPLAGAILDPTDALDSATPLALELLSECPQGDSVLLEFAANDVFRRTPIASRWSEFLAATDHPVAPVARWETALLTAKADPHLFLGEGSGLRLGTGTVVDILPANIADVAQRVDAGTVGLVDGELYDHDIGNAVTWEPSVQFIFGRDKDDNLSVAGLPVDAELDNLTPDELHDLKDMGLLVPDRFVL
jgi:hypothetical protein